MQNIMKSGLTPVNTKNAVYCMASSDELRGNIRGDSPMKREQKEEFSVSNADCRGKGSPLRRLTALPSYLYLVAYPGIKKGRGTASTQGHLQITTAANDSKQPPAFSIGAA